MHNGLKEDSSMGGVHIYQFIPLRGQSSTPLQPPLDVSNIMSSFGVTYTLHTYTKNATDGYFSCALVILKFKTAILLRKIFAWEAFYHSVALRQ